MLLSEPFLPTLVSAKLGGMYKSLLHSVSLATPEMADLGMADNIAIGMAAQNSIWAAVEVFIQVLSSGLSLGFL